MKRWQEEIVPAYPAASFSFQSPWFYGALRDDDETMHASDLGRLIDMLLEREKK